MREVVVVDKKKQMLLYGFIDTIGEDGTLITDDDQYADNNDQKFCMVTIDKSRYSENMKYKLPNVIYADTRCIYDKDTFGPNVFREIVSRKYNQGDYILGFASPLDTNLSKKYPPRLVGGVVLRSEIDACIDTKTSKFSPRIKYEIAVDVSYSLEQLWRDNMREDQFYAVSSNDLRAEVWEEHCITFGGVCYSFTPTAKEKLSVSGRYTLFYVMAFLVVMEQMRNLTHDNIAEFMNTAISAFSKKLWSDENNMPLDNAVLERYDVPMRLIMHNIFTEVGDYLFKYNDKLVESVMESSVLKDVIQVEDVGEIPWKKILNDFSGLQGFFSNKKICGIDKGAFIDKLNEYAKRIILNPNNTVYESNLRELSAILYGCMSDPIQEGVKVYIDQDEIDNILRDKPISNFITVNGLDMVHDEPTLVSYIKHRATRKAEYIVTMTNVGDAIGLPLIEIGELRDYKGGDITVAIRILLPKRCCKVVDSRFQEANNVYMKSVNE